MKLKTKIFFTGVVVIAVFTVTAVWKTRAGTEHFGYGWLWAGGTEADGSTPYDLKNTNVGWISLNNTNCDANNDGLSDVGPACPPAGTVIANYGMSIPIKTGCIAGDLSCQLSGMIWSENIGWISFYPDDVAGCPASVDDVTDYCFTQRLGNTLQGWGRILGIRDQGINAGGWQGWIKLSGSNTTAANTCSGGAKDGQSCAADPDCLETASCSLASTNIVSGDVYTQGSRVPIKFVGHGKHIDIYGNGGVTLSGTITLEGCKVTGSVQTQSDGIDIKLKANNRGDKINICRYDDASCWGFLNISNCTVSGDVITDSDAVDLRFMPNAAGNRLRLVNLDDTVGYGNLEFTPAYACPLVGGSACSGSPQTCSLAHVCSRASSNFTYGVNIDPATNKLFGQAWSNELGWIDFGRASLNVQNSLRICSGTCDSSGVVVPSLSFSYAGEIKNNIKACEVFPTESGCMGTDRTTDANWSSDDGNVATVSSAGATRDVTAVANGNTFLRASYGATPAAVPISVNIYVPACNNGIQDTGEDCDKGIDNGPCPKTCSSACKKNSCDNNWKEVAPQ